MIRNQYDALLAKRSRRLTVRGWCRVPAAVVVSLFVAVLVSTCEAWGQVSPHGELSIACEDCHNPASWKDVSGATKFDHARTGFALVGQHSQVSCRQCHQALKFVSTSTRCADCHQDIHRNELGTTCERCHSAQSWLVPDMAQRHNGTRFPLTGPHQTLPCQACHINQQKQEYVNIPVDCIGCHRSTYDATTNPAHQAAGFG